MKVEYPKYDETLESSVCPKCAFRKYIKVPTANVPMEYNNPCIICLWNTQLVKTNNFTEDENRKMLA